METAFSQMNYWAIITAAAMYFILGAVWYSPGLFEAAWFRNVRIPKESEKKYTRMTAGTFVLLLFAAIFLDYIVELSATNTPGKGVFLGLITGAGLVGTAMSTTYLYEGKPRQLFLIDIGYHLAGFTLMGLILGGWH
ncbi:MAG: DUF1761 domain-containing protein [Sporocytophaga sp.]|nr:DUF1761 domain-containing protein [Sporocytophaga sp.]